MDDILTRGNRLVEECSHAVSTVPQATLRHAEQPRWIAPPHKCIKLNVDAIVSPIKHKANIGGVFRDAHGRWILGFARFVVVVMFWSLNSGLSSMVYDKLRMPTFYG
ncbi:hypothetical protein V6N12_062543 [Hibiscus sabdariffa]|uniref:Uncharacterized protein n=1 Tax=Hibiscus sabdariffa TaxID=183260 RepID=A0ABR2F972_9ROSI